MSESHKQEMKLTEVSQLPPYMIMMMMITMISIMMVNDLIPQYDDDNDDYKQEMKL